MWIRLWIAHVSMSWSTIFICPMIVCLVEPHVDRPAGESIGLVIKNAIAFNINDELGSTHAIST
jgi:hypothetical protein